MTRFKELKRIEAAISHKDVEQLNWAEAYCRERLASANMKEHQKHWRKLLNKVEGAMNDEYD
jgi:hypothetical protein